MLVGTTFAWFTDTANTGINKIRAGNLKVVLEYAKPGDITWSPVGANTQLFSSTGWEPGYTQVVYIRVQNAGTLALKHTIAANIIGESVVLNVAGEKMSLSQYLQVDLREFSGDPTASTIDRTQIGINTSAMSSNNKISAFSYDGGKLLPEDTKIYQLAIYMPTSVGNEANYRGKVAPAITFGLKVTASQEAHESDSFGNTYDAYAPGFISVRNGKELERAFVDAKPGKDIYVLLEEDIDLNASFMRIIREKHTNQVGVGVGNVVINGNGHKISTNYAGTAGVISAEYAESDRSITFLDTVIQSKAANASGDETRGLAAFELANGTINLIGCTIETADSQNGIGIKLLRSKNVTINLTDCMISAAVPIEFEGSADCVLNLKDSVLKATSGGLQIVEKNSSNINCNR